MILLLKIFGIDSIIYPKLKHRILLVSSPSEAKASGWFGVLAIQSKFGPKAKASGSFGGLAIRS
jgi:hypothetical protein